MHLIERLYLIDLTNSLLGTVLLMQRYISLSEYSLLRQDDSKSRCKAVNEVNTILAALHPRMFIMAYLVLLMHRKENELNYEC